MLVLIHWFFFFILTLTHINFTFYRYTNSVLSRSILNPAFIWFLPLIFNFPIYYFFLYGYFLGEVGVDFNCSFQCPTPPPAPPQRFAIILLEWKTKFFYTFIIRLFLVFFLLFFSSNFVFNKCLCYEFSVLHAKINHLL